MHMEWIIGLVAVILIFGSGLIQQWIKSDHEIRRIKAEREAGLSRDALRTLEELKREVAELRDTTTKFDMSFDAAIARLERRVDHLEEQSLPRHTVTPVAPESENVILRQQGR